MSTQLSMVKGESKDFTAQITVGASVVNVTAGKLFFTAKRSTEDADPGVFQLSWIAGVASGITVADPTTGVATIGISPADTDAIPFTGLSLPWDLKFVEAGGKVHVVASGVLSVTKQITRSV